MLYAVYGYAFRCLFQQIATLSSQPSMLCCHDIDLLRCSHGYTWNSITDAYYYSNSRSTNNTNVHHCQTNSNSCWGKNIPDTTTPNTIPLTIRNITADRAHNSDFNCTSGGLKQPYTQGKNIRDKRAGTCTNPTPACSSKPSKWVQYSNIDNIKL